jgi:hypothetical protein
LGEDGEGNRRREKQDEFWCGSNASIYYM